GRGRDGGVHALSAAAAAGRAGPFDQRVARGGPAQKAVLSAVAAGRTGAGAAGGRVAAHLGVAGAHPVNNHSGEGGRAMGLIEKYLRAVAAQLPPDAREDVIAELRDDLMSRVEAK